MILAQPATAPFREPLEALRVILPAQAFSEPELRELLPICALLCFDAEHELIHEGEPSDNRVYFLLSGSVSVSIQGSFILRLHSRGDTIGEMGLISAAPRSATVRTDEPSQVLAINATLPDHPKDLRDYKLRYYLGRIFNTILTEKLRTTSDRARLYEDILSHSQQVEHQRQTLEVRIADYLQQIRLYSHLVNSANDAILITDPTGHVLNANRALTSVFGIATDAVIGMEAVQVIALPPGGPDGWPALAQAAAAGGWHGEVAVSHPQQGAIPADCSVSTVHDKEQALLAYSVILHDIRRRKALEAETQRQGAELERVNAELRQMDRTKSHFLSLVSHELRTPISSILAYSELLNTEGMVEPEEQSQFVDVIHKEAGRLTELVNKVLAISKLESGQMLFTFAEAELEPLVLSIVAMQRGRATSKGVTLELELTAPLRPLVCDEETLREAIAQLVDNAIKYTDTGEIKVQVAQTTGETLIRVTDTGKGIEGLEIETLLETFGRGEPVNIGTHGLGLGLPLCYLIVKAHSGSIHLQSRQERGTEATITLPMRSSSEQ